MYKHSLSSLFAAALLASLVISAAPASAAVNHDAGALAQRSNVPGLTSAQYADSFVKRSGSHLTVAGRRFRFAGANGEFLGLRNYGPIPSAGQKRGTEAYATKFEIDDELATLHEMGATVVRAQTIGDTVGCSLCSEPRLGQFNPRAFREMDLVVAQARRFGIKIIGEFDGDANGTEPYGPPTPGAVVGNASSDWYCSWNHISQSQCPTATFEDPRILADYERHMKAVLDHVNPYTGLAYKNDPTFAGWVDGNNLWLLNPTPLPKFQSWLTKVSAYFKSIDHKQLFIDISAAGGDYLTPGETGGLGPNLGPTPAAGVLHVPGVDLYGQEWYPKDFPALDPNDPAAKQIHTNARAVAAAGKAYATIEFGWDHYNYSTPSILSKFLAGLRADHNVSGDLFWELAAHANGHGWQAIPANQHCRPTCKGLVEDGSWWAMYYTGRPTASNTAPDMAARAQIIRSAAYRMDAFVRVPAHEIPPPPVITSTRGGRVLFEGSAGADSYSIQKWVHGRWMTPCDRCTNDNANGWQDRTQQAGSYRAVAYNLAGKPSAPSRVAVGPGGAQAGRASAAAAGSKRSAPDWVSSWSSPPISPGPLAAAVPFDSGTGGRTVRDVIHLTLGGRRLRLRLSNVFGSRPARFSDVRLAVRSSGAGIVAGTSRRVRFGANDTVTLAPGRQLTSDPIPVAVRAGEDLSISIYAPDSTGEITGAGSLNHTNYISGPGDVTGSVDARSFPVSSQSWYWIGGVDVVPANRAARAIVALGDSITAGYDSTPNANRDWVSLLSDRLRASHDPVSVINAGIAGNELHASSPCYGQSAVQRLDRDVLQQAGARYVILDEGVNDITQPNEPRSAPLSGCLPRQKVSAREMIVLFKRTVARIHARGLKVIGVTLSPFARYQYWTPAIEAERQQINRWIRTTATFDGVIDFDRVLRAPAHSAWLNPRFDSGDGLHPNNAGHAAMARAIRLSLFTG